MLRLCCYNYNRVLGQNPDFANPKVLANKEIETAINDDISRLSESTAIADFEERNYPCLWPCYKIETKNSFQGKDAKEIPKALKGIIAADEMPNSTCCHSKLVDNILHPRQMCCTSCYMRKTNKYASQAGCCVFCGLICCCAGQVSLGTAFTVIPLSAILCCVLKENRERICGIFEIDDIETVRSNFRALRLIEKEIKQSAMCCSSKAVPDAFSLRVTRLTLLARSEYSLLRAVTMTSLDPNIMNDDPEEIVFSKVDEIVGGKRLDPAKRVELREKCKSIADSFYPSETSDAGRSIKYVNDMGVQHVVKFRHIKSEISNILAQVMTNLDDDKFYCGSLYPKRGSDDETEKVGFHQNLILGDILFYGGMTIEEIGNLTGPALEKAQEIVSRLFYQNFLNLSNGDISNNHPVICPKRLLPIYKLIWERLDIIDVSSRIKTATSALGKRKEDDMTDMFGMKFVSRERSLFTTLARAYSISEKIFADEMVSSMQTSCKLRNSSYIDFKMIVYFADISSVCEIQILNCGNYFSDQIGHGHDAQKAGKNLDQWSPPSSAFVRAPQSKTLDR